ncbi:hypothetical protein QYF61_017802 [Mycteria americana]|uniref:Uncharacterized protein n=1 Tax=Mycteria americana TaxID=33587 RepID=A0AAN7NL59_MYCAM|nr:hypothetical protein QYF61_017802 [Mycteria americana]
MAQGNLTNVDKYLTGGNEAVRDGLFSVASSDRSRDNGTQHLNIRKNFFYCEGAQTLEQINCKLFWAYAFFRQDGNVPQGNMLVKKEVYWLRKGSQIAIEDYKNLARAFRDEVRKAKAQLQLKLDKDVKNNNKEFFRYVSSKQKHRADIGPLLNKAGKLVTNNVDKAELLNTFFASVFNAVAGPQITGSSSYNKTHVDPPRDILDGKCHLQDGPKEDPGNYRPISPTSIHAKVMEQVILEIITN